MKLLHLLYVREINYFMKHFNIAIHLRSCQTISTSSPSVKRGIFLKKTRWMPLKFFQPSFKPLREKKFKFERESENGGREISSAWCQFTYILHSSPIHPPNVFYLLPGVWVAIANLNYLKIFENICIAGRSTWNAHTNMMMLNQLYLSIHYTHHHSLHTYKYVKMKMWKKWKFIFEEMKMCPCLTVNLVSLR